ncbi:ABC transporter permease subunit, partial [Thioclava sp. BHET1]
MSYHFDFSWLLDYYPQILHGIAITIELIAVAAVIGIALGIFCAWARALGPGWLKPPVTAYVELIRNTPFLIQLFFLYYGLPQLGLRLNELEAANLAMVVNL